MPTKPKFRAATSAVGSVTSQRLCSGQCPQRWTATTNPTVHSSQHSTRHRASQSPQLHDAIDDAEPSFITAIGECIWELLTAASVAQSIAPVDGSLALRTPTTIPLSTNAAGSVDAVAIAVVAIVQQRTEHEQRIQWNERYERLRLDLAQHIQQPRRNQWNELRRNEWQQWVQLVQQHVRWDEWNAQPSFQQTQHPVWQEQLRTPLTVLERWHRRLLTVQAKRQRHEQYDGSVESQTTWLGSEFIPTTAEIVYLDWRTT